MTRPTIAAPAWAKLCVLGAGAFMAGVVGWNVWRWWA